MMEPWRWPRVLKFAEASRYDGYSCVYNNIETRKCKLWAQLTSRRKAWAPRSWASREGQCKEYNVDDTNICWSYRFAWWQGNDRWPSRDAWTMKQWARDRKTVWWCAQPCEVGGGRCSPRTSLAHKWNCREWPTPKEKWTICECSYRSDHHDLDHEHCFVVSYCFGNYATSTWWSQIN